MKAHFADSIFMTTKAHITSASRSGAPPKRSSGAPSRHPKKAEVKGGKHRQARSLASAGHYGIRGVEDHDPLALLGVTPEPKSLAEAALQRVDTRALLRMEQAHFLTRPEISHLVIPARTLSHRIAHDEKLTVDESDKLLRVARLIDHAIRVFGDKDKAQAWLRRPNPRFDGEPPLEMARTEHGARLVEEALIQLDEGIFA